MSPEPQEKSETSSQPGPEALQAMKARGERTCCVFLGFLRVSQKDIEKQHHIHFQDMTDDIYNMIESIYIYS